jgi:hypothetical protein
VNGEGQEGQGGVFTVDTGEVAFAFLAVVEEYSENLGQLLMVLRSQDEAALGATDTCSCIRSGGEAAEDEDEDIVCEDGHFVPLIRGLLLHIDEDLVEWGQRWKWQRYA